MYHKGQRSIYNTAIRFLPLNASAADNMIRPVLCFTTLILGLVATADADVYELRIYETNEGKLDPLNARFRDHTVRLFEKHGIESIGYWVPTDEDASKNTLVYIIKHDSRDAAKASWKAFGADPQWHAARDASGVGNLAKKPRSIYMEATDYSPVFENGDSDDDDVFELRIYKAAEGKLDKLDARFRDHTVGLFNKHGIRSFGYWHPTDEPDSQDTLVYLIEHDNADAAKVSWKSFGNDPDWKAAAAASGVGKLAAPIESIYMKSTDYSAVK